VVLFCLCRKPEEFCIAGSVSHATLLFRDTCLSPDTHSCFCIWQSRPSPDLSALVA
jgi:hypothetical protein